MRRGRSIKVFQSINPLFVGVVLLFLFTGFLVITQVFQASATSKSESTLPQYGWWVCADLGYGEVPGASASNRFRLCHPTGWEVLAYCLDNSKPQPPIGTACEHIGNGRFWCGDDYQQIEQYELSETPIPSATPTSTRTSTVTPTHTTSSTTSITHTPTSTKTQGPTRTSTSTRTLTPNPTRTRPPFLTKTTPPPPSPTRTSTRVMTITMTPTSTETQPAAYTPTPTVTTEPSQTLVWEGTTTSTPYATNEVVQTPTPTPTQRPKLGGGGYLASAGQIGRWIWAVVVGMGISLHTFIFFKDWIFRRDRF